MNKAILSEKLIEYIKLLSGIRDKKSIKNIHKNIVSLIVLIAV